MLHGVYGHLQVRFRNVDCVDTLEHIPLAIHLDKFKSVSGVTEEGRALELRRTKNRCYLRFT